MVTKENSWLIYVSFYVMCIEISEAFIFQANLENFLSRTKRYSMQQKPGESLLVIQENRS